MAHRDWRALAAAQHGLITRAQLAAAGVDRWAVRHRIASGRWAARSETVVSTITGELDRRQRRWLGVLHAGGRGAIGDLSALEVAGLRNWEREEITVIVPKGTELGEPIPGVRFVWSRRPVTMYCRPGEALPVWRVEPAVLHFAAYQRSTRTAQGVLAAVVQQRLTTPDRLGLWLRRMKPLYRAPLFRQVIADIAGGAHSTAEIDVRRMCRAHGLALPRRQVRRRDSSGRVRFTDCEWRLPGGRTLVLEVDGAFHMEVEHWEDDLARQRALTSPDRIVVRCTNREVRDADAPLARDLRNLGVPLAA